MENQAIYEVVKKSKLQVSVNYKEFDHIELTEEETQIALYFAKKAKDGKIKEKAYWEKVRNPDPIVKFNYDQTRLFYLKKAKAMVPNFVLDEFNEPIFDLLCEYFSSDEETKGLIITGPVGCGKTTLMRIFAENQKNSFQVISCRQVSYEFSTNGFESIEKHSKSIYTSENRFGQRMYGTCFDDLGTEEKRIHFGNNVNVMQDVILNRYDKVQLGLTHITTNLTADQIKEIYGERTSSRMREMFKVFSFDVHSKDLRK